jgi:hypothetical protein
MKPREIVVEGDIGRIPLSKGYVAIIDATDVHLVEGHNWCATCLGKRVYAMRTGRKDGRYQSIRLHRVLLGVTDPDIFVDHCDGDGLNNRRINLRECSNAENMRNRGAQSNNASGFKGVWWDAKRGKWIAELHVLGMRKYAGAFYSMEAAHAAYADAAAKFHGQFARVS